MKRNTHTDFGAAYIGRLRRERSVLGSHIVILICSLIWSYLWLSNGGFSMMAIGLSIFSMVFSITGLRDDWRDWRDWRKINKIS
ncbi:MAG: hypothetical protein AABY22_22710 [Nanoarchaeota archaeon]